VARQCGHQDLEKTATGLFSIISWAFTFAADMFAAVTDVEVKNRRRKEMMGNCFDGFSGIWLLLYLQEEGQCR